MKRMLLSMMLMGCISLAASAQTMHHAKIKSETSTSETKSKPTSTVPQKVHNAIHPRHKHYNGHKSKHKTSAK